MQHYNICPYSTSSSYLAHVRRIM